MKTATTQLDTTQRSAADAIRPFHIHVSEEALTNLRFQNATIVAGEPFRLRTRPPTERERQVIHRSLALFTPWGAPHLPPPAPNGSILETHFDGVCGQSDWDRIHALVDPGCAGLPRLIREYNESFPRGSTARLDDPDHTLTIPCFAA
jgi:hypothetical protein